MTLADWLRVVELVAGVFALFAIIRWDLRDNEFATGAGMLAAILLIMIMSLTRLLDVDVPWRSEMVIVGITCLFFAIGRFYYQRRG